MERIKGWWQRLRGFATRHWLGIALTSVLTVLVTQVATEKFNELRSGPAEYKVFVVGGKARVDGRSDFAYHMKQAIEETWESREVTVRGKPVTVEYREDNWDADTAEAVSRQLAARNDILLVIGHFASTTSKKALKNYLEPDPPIPVIFTTETNPHLLPEVGSELHPVFRLWPTDKEQAQTIVDFVSSRKEVFWVVGDRPEVLVTSGSRSFWVVEDTGSRVAVYSEYLAEEMVRSLQRAGQTVVLRSDTRSIPAAGTLENLHIDAIIFAGEASNALIFISQIRPVLKDELPNIFLTDASVADVLRNEEHLETLDGVYISHPALISCKDILSIEGPLSETARLAADAARIARTIIDRAKTDIHVEFWKNLFGVEDVEDIRRALVQEMGKRSPYQGFEDREYKFGEGGVDERGHFRLWQIRNRRFVPVDEGCDSLVNVETPIVETWIRMLLGNLKTDQEVFAGRFALLRGAAVLNGKILGGRSVSDEELTLFDARITDNLRQFNPAVHAYFINLRDKAKRLNGIGKDLGRDDLSENARRELMREKEGLLGWFNRESLELTNLFREQLRLTEK